ncbi:hypothetical protein J6590_028446 [Homalodisca vitripennis]|nr:hypothetical protein J6590_028446 [Homalodisca vitripennis]
MSEVGEQRHLLSTSVTRTVTSTPGSDECLRTVFMRCWICIVLSFSPKYKAKACLSDVRGWHQRHSLSTSVTRTVTSTPGSDECLRTVFMRCWICIVLSFSPKYKTKSCLSDVRGWHQRHSLSTFVTRTVTSTPGSDECLRTVFMRCWICIVLSFSPKYKTKSCLSDVREDDCIVGVGVAPIP